LTLTHAHFARTLAGIADVLPYGKAVTKPGLLLSWQTFPEQAKAELTNDHLSYASGQYLMDPDRPKDQPIHLALLRYLYRLENGSPNFAWGLKLDLPARMANPTQFHPEPVPQWLEPSARPLEPRHDPNGLLARLNGLTGDLRSLSAASEGQP
jgi:hypothetical protein